MDEAKKTKDSQQQWQDIVDTAREVIGLFIIEFALFNEKKNVFEVKAISGLGPPKIQAAFKRFQRIIPGFCIEKITHSPTVNPFIKKVIETKKFSLTKNLVELTENFLPRRPIQIAQKVVGIKMIGFFPLVSRDKVIGFMAILSPKKITEREIKITQAFIGQIVKTLEAHKLVQELKEKVQETEKLNKMMIGRELRMVGLKQEIKKLRGELKKK